MTFIIISLIVALLGGIVTLFFSSEMVGELYTTVFDCGQYLTTVSGVEFFSLLMPVSYGFGISLIILKFLKKAFDIYGLTMEQEYFPGFGSRELRQFLIGGAVSAVLGALLLIFSGQLLTLIVCIMIGASGSIMAVRKDPYTRISVVTQIGNMIKFRRTQQNFRYVYKSPWEQS